MKLTRRRLLTGAAGLFVASAAVVGVILHGGRTTPPTPSRASLYSASTACLLTDSRGVGAAPASAVWAGMQDASVATHAKVTYQTVNGAATTANAIPYANSLVEEDCDVVLAVGDPQTSALTQIAERNPKTNFVIVGGSTASAEANLKAIGLSPSTRGLVEQAIAAVMKN